MDTIQMTLRGVPVAVAEVLRAQAKEAGKSLNQYMIDRLPGDTARLTILGLMQSRSSWQRPKPTTCISPFIY